MGGAEIGLKKLATAQEDSHTFKVEFGNASQGRET
jgi:hypothetical protein